MQTDSFVADCQFTSTALGQWVCPNCDYRTSPKRYYDKPPHRACPNAPDLKPIAQRLAEETGDPTILDKTAHCGVALIRWAFSGFKTRSKEEVARIYTDHCQPCDHRDPEADACKLCGCNVRIEGVLAVLNKIKMRTEICPKDKWK